MPVSLGEQGWWSRMRADRRRCAARFGRPGLSGVPPSHPADRADQPEIFVMRDGGRVGPHFIAREHRRQARAGNIAGNSALLPPVRATRASSGSRISRSAGGTGQRSSSKSCSREAAGRKLWPKRRRAGQRTSTRTSRRAAGWQAELEPAWSASSRIAGFMGATRRPQANRPPCEAIETTTTVQVGWGHSGVGVADRMLSSVLSPPAEVPTGSKDRLL